MAAANELLLAEGFEPSVNYAPRNTVPAGSEVYDGLVIGWGAYMLVPGRDRRVTLLRELRSRVDTGAPILLSFFARRRRDVQLRIAADVGSFVRRILGRERVEVGDSLEPNFVHWFLEDEIASELAAGGFTMEFFAAAPYGHAVPPRRAPSRLTEGAAVFVLGACSCTAGTMTSCSPTGRGRGRH